MVKVGRKQQSTTWNFIKYDCIKDKSGCIVIKVDDKICINNSLEEKNPTNLAAWRGNTDNCARNEPPPHTVRSYWANIQKHV